MQGSRLFVVLVESVMYLVEHKHRRKNRGGGRGAGGIAQRGSTSSFLKES